MTEPAAIAHDPHAHGLAHVMGMKTLVAVFATLIVLTFLTVAATWVDLGPFNLYLAMGIAAIKGLLVVLYFMHLRYDKPFNLMVFTATLGFAVLFIGLVLTDADAYRETRDFSQSKKVERKPAPAQNQAPQGH